jgi:hypothetical protein
MARGRLEFWKIDEKGGKGAAKTDEEREESITRRARSVSERNDPAGSSPFCQPEPQGEGFFIRFQEGGGNPLGQGLEESPFADQAHSLYHSPQEDHVGRHSVPQLLQR